MSITDELREYTEKQIKWLDMTKVHYHKLFEIADRIDSEYQKAMDEWKAKHGQMWLKGYSECHAELLEGNETLASDLESCGWVRLPKDADGEYIHVGDEMDGYGKTIEVVELCIGRSGWVIVSRDGNAYDDTFAFTHHKPPTVEDVLREFLEDWRASTMADGDDIIAKYATKLQLKEDA